MQNDKARLLIFIFFFSCFSYHAYGKSQKVAVLVQQLGNKNVNIRIKAILALGKMRYRAEKAVPTLSTLLFDKNYRIRKAAIKALDEISEIKKAIPFLIKALRDRKPYIRKAAARLLGLHTTRKNRAAVSALLVTVKDTDHGVRGAAILAIASLEPKHPKVIEVYIEGLRHRNIDVWMTVVEVLRNRETLPKKVFWPLIRVIGKHKSARKDAIFALSRIRPKMRKGASSIAKYLWSRNKDVRINTIYTMSHLNVKKKWFIRYLIKMISHREFDVSSAAISALGAIGPKASPAVPALRRYLRKGWSAHGAIWALGKIGGAAKSVVPELLKIVRKPCKREPDRFVPSCLRPRREGIIALIRISPRHKALKGTIQLVFKRDQGYYFQKRVEKELKNQGIQ